MCKSIAYINQKGGVGKSTTAINTAYELSVKGYKVLLVDIDPQGTAARRTLAKDPEELGYTLYHLLKTMLDVPTHEVNISKCIYHSERYNIDVIPPHINMSSLDIKIAISNTYKATEMLIRALEPVINSYDYILVDCPPSLSAILYAALGFVENVIIPVLPDETAIEGIEQLNNTIADVEAISRKRINVLGSLMSRYRYTTLHNSIKSIALSSLDMFENYIPETVDVQNASQRKQPVSLFKPQSKAAIAYRIVTEEIIRKVEEQEVCVC